MNIKSKMKDGSGKVLVYMNHAEPKVLRMSCSLEGNEGQV